MIFPCVSDEEIQVSLWNVLIKLFKPINSFVKFVKVYVFKSLKYIYEASLALAYIILS